MLLGVASATVSCTKPSAVAGHYVCDRDRTPPDTLDLEADGTFTLHEDGATLTGTYTSNGDSLAFTLPGRDVAAFRVEGAVLVDPAGGRWMKE